MDKRLEKLRISFSDGWKNISHENPEGPPTFIKEASEEPGVLQISTAEYLGGEHPNPTFSDLIELSEKTGLNNQFGNIQNKETGNCKYGKYGFVEFARPNFPYIAV
ncbi:MAG TPA: hypothetical protein VF939_22275 [Puia sp.]